MRVEDQLYEARQSINDVRQWLENQTRIPDDRLEAIMQEVVDIEGECACIRAECIRLEAER